MDEIGAPPSCSPQTGDAASFLKWTWHVALDRWVHYIPIDYVVMYKMIKYLIWCWFIMTSLLKWAGDSPYFLEWNEDATSTFLGTVGMAPPPWMGWACNLHLLKWDGHPILLSYGTCLCERKLNSELIPFQCTTCKYSEPNIMRWLLRFSTIQWK